MKPFGVVVLLCILTFSLRAQQLSSAFPGSIFTNHPNKIRFGIRTDSVGPLATTFLLIKSDSNYLRDTAWRQSNKMLDYVLLWKNAPPIAMDSTRITVTVTDPTSGESRSWRPLLVINHQR
jgi:hypothetical protein